MLRFLRSTLTLEDLEAIVDSVERASSPEDAFALAKPLVEAQAKSKDAALALVHLVGGGRFAREQCLELLRAMFEAHSDDASIVASVANAYDMAHDVRYLNAAPPCDPLPETVLQRVLELLEHAEGDVKYRLLSGLGTAGRLLGRAHDAEVERAYLALVELKPDAWQLQYDLGLFYKTRGRFEDGMRANQRAAAMGGGDVDSVQWNLGICATGARQGAIALEIWQAKQQKVALGRYELPEGNYHSVRVQLAKHPLAERDAANDDPGQEETIWIERLSPCHGVVRSVLYADLGVDYGDVVLFDGAPITYHTYRDERVAVFPHLATLVRSGYQRWPFAGTQQRELQMRELGDKLPEDSVVYVHTEQVEQLCRECWENDQRDHTAHAPSEHGVVRGKICVPPHLEPKAILRALDAAVASAPGLRVFAPELCQAAGERERAAVEHRRFDMLSPAEPTS